MLRATDFPYTVKSKKKQDCLLMNKTQLSIRSLHALNGDEGIFAGFKLSRKN